MSDTLSAELRRRDEQGDIQPWELVTDELSPTGRADPVADFGARGLLATAVATLGTAAGALAGKTVLSLLDAANSRLEAVEQALAGTLQVAGDVVVTNFPAVQAVSGPLTDAQLRAAAVLVTATDLALPEGAASDVKLDLIFNRLGDIFGAVDGLEVTAGNIEISSETINLQTDEVEDLLREVRDLDTRIIATLGESAGQTVLARLGTIAGRLPELVDGTMPVSGTVTVDNPTADPETGLAKEDTLGQVRDRIGTVSGKTVALSLDSIDGKVAEQATLLALQQAAGTAADANTLGTHTGLLKRIRDSVWDGNDSLLAVTMSRLPAALESGRLKVASRSRDEDSAHLWHNAGGVISIAAGQWVTLASVIVPTGKKLRLLDAEGDFADIGAISNARAIRIRKAGTVMAPALTGSDQPTPDIEGLTMENTSGADEIWDLQGRHNAVTSQNMAGWMTLVEVST